MKRKINLKIIILTSAFAFILLLLGTTKSQAVLQANPTTHRSPVSKTGASWITVIRQMETTGQTMGLTETLNGLNATSENNGIDVHMMLPTEYGAVAILSASGYGNSGKLRDESDAQKRTTTGNATGVYFTGDRWEYVALCKGMDASKYNVTNLNAIGVPLSAPYGLGWHNGGAIQSLPSNREDMGSDSWRCYGFGGSRNIWRWDAERAGIPVDGVVTIGIRLNFRVEEPPSVYKIKLML